MEENRRHSKLSGGKEGRTHLALSLRPLLGILRRRCCACLSMALNALTPQIIRITVDSILGSEGGQLPALVLRVLPLETLRQEPVAVVGGGGRRW